MEDFASCTPNLFKNVSLAIIVYSIDNKESFDHSFNWRNIVLKYSPNVITFIVGNKNDLEDQRKIKKEEVQKYMDEGIFHFFIETCPNDSKFRKEIIQQILAQLYELYEYNKNLEQLNEEIKKTKNKGYKTKLKLNKKDNKFLKLLSYINY